jgi:outer membrane murein-binding lipoprotein Lpp
MSESEGYEKQVIHEDGVTVTKRFEEDEFPVPAIAFEFTSDRDESVWVSLSDTVPEGVEVEDLGFHPEYGSEFWMIDDETITFERELDSDDSYTTVYGIRATGTEDVEQFLTEPTLDEVDPPLPEDEQASGAEDIIPESGDDVVEEAILGDGEIPGLEETEAEIDDEDVGTLELNDPNSEGTTAENAPDAAVTADSIVSAFVAELREGTAPAEDVKVLQQAFAVESSDSDGSADAKIEQLQTDIADLRAYTSALEEFLDEEGTGQQLIEDFEERLASFEDQLDGMQSEVSTQGSELETALEEMETVSENVESVEREVETVEDELDSLTEDIESVESSIADLESDVERIDEDLVNGEVLDQIEAMQESIDDLQAWQEQIKKTFGGS